MHILFALQMFRSLDISKTLMVVYMAELPMFRNDAWCLKRLYYRSCAVISQILLSMASEEPSDRCWECKSLAKVFCQFVLNPDVTYQPDLPASNVMGQYRTAQKRCRQSPGLTGSPLRSLSSRCLILTVYIYLQLQWLEQEPLVC